MWKVSFKDPKYKKVQKFNDRVTIVTLKGDLRIPMEVMNSMPGKMWKWMADKINPRVKVYPWQGIINIIVTGKAVRSKDDEDDPVLAERIAECRAKIAIYNFVSHLIYEYIHYYLTLTMGKNNKILVDLEQNDSLNTIFRKYVILEDKKSKHLSKLIESAKSNG